MDDVQKHGDQFPMLPFVGYGTPLAWAIIHYGVLHLQPAVALPGNSEVDGNFVGQRHTVEVAFARKEAEGLVMMDIQGALDVVLRVRLVLRFREQGWPQHSARWGNGPRIRCWPVILIPSLAMT